MHGCSKFMDEERGLNHERLARMQDSEAGGGAFPRRWVAKGLAEQESSVLVGTSE